MSTRTKRARIWVAGDGKTERLVRALNEGAALRHVYAARVASQDDLERLITKGVRVESAIPGADNTEPATPTE
jgi:hypothetical protein